MKKIIVDNSSLECSLGTKPSSIKVSSQGCSKIEGQLVATEADKASVSNIPSFGNCKRVWYNPICKPMPIAWSSFAKDNKINGLSKLLINSTCDCSYGGIISFY